VLKEKVLALEIKSGALAFSEIHFMAGLEQMER